MNQSQISAALPVGKGLITPARLADLMVPVMPQVGARRSAIQSRSQEKLARVLQSTAAFLDETGPEAVTTTSVAARAEVSIGWLYNFFDDREALLEEVMVSGLVRLDRQLDDVGFSLAGPDWRTTLVAGIDTVIEFFDASSGFRSLWFSAEFTGRMLQANRLHDDALAAYLAASVTETRPDAPDVPMDIVTQVLVGMLDKGLDLAYRNDRAGDKNMLDEMTRASVDYIGCFLL
ncbi:MULTISPECIES: TetR/AcrR family transcriptional regulator [unclassified Mycobacterium]|uniref:TetR/AcrR family transcriptional regulator n=1 Tax=unclassified Mycobacterium TaxID=2642494 RepID=UPI0029C6415E|nr:MULTISPECIES: TetR/AcrR family transcriptional regulator [unclassified Mycobacterium]